MRDAAPSAPLEPARHPNPIDSAAWHLDAHLDALALLPDDLAREVYCVLGVPVDAVNMATVLGRIEAAAASPKPFLLSTLNLNFLATSLADRDFAASIHLSDLCTADGAPIVWICRALGVPIRERITGSDILEELKQRSGTSAAMRVAFFGGAEGVAEAACKALNERAGGLVGVGSMYPGFGSVDDLSTEEYIDAINRSTADFLVVALGALKGQAWLMRNYHRLKTPVRAHLGAAINFQAGTLRRAPRVFQKLGLEWLWRIKEEPHLWRRYWRDGWTLLRLSATRVLPLAILLRRYTRRAEREVQELDVRVSAGEDALTLRLAGSATHRTIEMAIQHFRAALATDRPRLIVDLAAVSSMDARFLGLILMLRKGLSAKGGVLQLAGPTRAMTRFIRLNEVGFLLEPSREGRC